MNYLAHALLSAGEPEMIQLGNLACDMIDPRVQDQLPEQIRRGMAKHQAIDRATDSHPAFKNTRAILSYEKIPYAGVLTDIIYDHFLSRCWDSYHDRDLPSFSSEIYRLLDLRSSEIPGSFQRMAGALVAQDWFGSYGSRDGLENALIRLNYRTSRPLPVNEIISCVFRSYESIQSDFELLMPDLISDFTSHKST